MTSIIQFKNEWMNEWMNEGRIIQDFFLNLKFDSFVH
jgi:hypothetical protein